MSLYDDFLKETKPKEGSLSAQFDSEVGGATPKSDSSKSFYQQYLDDMADKPVVEAAPEKSFMEKYKETGKRFQDGGDLSWTQYLNPVYAFDKGLSYVKGKASDALAKTDLIKGAAFAYDEADAGRVNLTAWDRFGPEFLSGLADPTLTLLNTKTGAKVTGAIYEGSSNLPLKAVARLKAIGDKSYEDAYEGMLKKRNDPNNSQFEKVLYGLQDSGIQSAIGVLLGVTTAYLSKNPKAAQYVTAPYFAAISAEAQRKEKGKVTSKTDIAIDTIGDTMISGLAEKALRTMVTEGGSTLLRSVAKSSAQGFAVEGVTEPTQTFLKYANEYSNAPTASEKQKVVQKVTDYVKGGGLLQEFLVAGISGGLIGGGAAATGGMLSKTDVGDKIKSSEAFDVEGAIKNGDITRDMVYKDGDILQPSFAQGRIDDVAQKLDMAIPGLGQKLRSEVDVENTTYQNIVDTGMKILNAAPEVNPNMIPETKGGNNEDEKKTEEENNTEKQELQNRIVEINNEIKKTIDNTEIPTKKREAAVVDLSEELARMNARLQVIDGRTARMAADQAEQTDIVRGEAIKNITAKVGGLSESEQVAAIEKAFSNQETRTAINKTANFVDANAYIQARGIDPNSVDITDAKNFIVENTAGKRAVLVDMPIENFGNPKFETLNQDAYEAGRKITSPIEVTMENGELVITDGANRFTQALANGDKTIPSVVMVVGKSNPTQGDVLASPVPIRAAGGRFNGSVSDKATTKMSVEKLSSMTGNSLSRSSVGMREKSLQYFRENPQEITAKPVRIREVDGKIVIEDGRHRLQVAKELGIDNISIEDVTPQYTGKKSSILKESSAKPSATLASTKGGQKTVQKILERMAKEGPSEIQDVPADFKISERAKSILEEFGAPVAEKGISNRFLGLYKTNAKKIRVQALYDITTVTHEAVHAIDDQIGFTKKLIASTKNGAEVRKQLTEIYEKLYPGGNKAHKLEKRMQEGLAVLFENYFYNPAEISAAYPGLVKSFINTDGEFYDPQFTKLLERMNELVEDYANLTPEQRIASRIRTGKEVVERDTGFTVKQRAVFEVFNRFEPLKRYAKQAGVSETWNDPTVQAFNVLNKNSIVSEWVKGASTPILLANGDFRVEKGSVAEYLELVKGSDKEFYAYLVARRVHEANNNLNALKNELAELESGDNGVDNGDNQELKDKIAQIESVIQNDDFSASDAAAVVTKYGKQFAEAEKIYDDINRRLIDVMVENDLLDQETADTYKAEKGYASFKRFVDDELNSVGTLQSASKSRVTSLKQRTGSQLDLQSPVQSQILAINEIIGKAFENRLWNKVADLTRGNPEIAQRFERIEAMPAMDANGNVSFPQEKDPNTIRVFKNGKREFYKVAPEFAAVTKTLRGKEFDLFVQLMRVPASAFTRLTTSANPLFAVGNITVDQFTATTQSKTGFKPVVDPIKSLVAVIKGDEGIKIYKAIGGKRQTLAAYFDLSPDEVVHKLTGGETKTEKVIGLIDTAISAMEFPSNTSEIMTRYAEFARSIEKGEPMSVAMYRATEVTTPFQLQGNMGGRFGQEYIKSIPYLNATLQVIYKFGRTAKSDPKRVIAMYGGLFAVALTSAIALMKGASDEQKRLLGEQPARNFSRYLYVPSPDGKNLIKIRIPEQFGALTGMVYMYVIGAYGGNEATFNDYLDNVMSALPEQVNVTSWANAKKAALSYIPQVLKPTVQAAANVKVFPDVAPIVPPYVVDKAPKEQYNTYTSGVAKTIGALLGTSPMLTDFWIKQQFGTVPSWFLGQDPANPIFVKEADFVMSGRSYNRFYDNKTLVTQQYDEIRKNNPDKYSDTDKEMIKIEKGSYDRMSEALSDMRKISQTKEIPDEMRRVTYDILLNIDTEGADQEEVRAKIGELKGLIGEMKE